MVGICRFRSFKFSALLIRMPFELGLLMLISVMCHFFRLRYHGRSTRLEFRCSRVSFHLFRELPVLEEEESDDQNQNKATDGADCYSGDCAWA